MGLWFIPLLLAWYVIVQWCAQYWARRWWFKLLAAASGAALWLAFLLSEVD